VALLCLAFFSTPRGSAQDQPLANLGQAKSPPPKFTFDWLWRDSQVTPGGAAIGAILVSLNEPWHIMAGVGSGEEVPGLFSSQVSLTAPTNWTITAIQWPESKKLTVPGVDGPVPLYAGKFPVFVQIQCSADAPLGPADVAFVFSYQTCDDHVCKAPADANLTAQIQVVDSASAPSTPSADPVFTALQSDFGTRAGTRSTDSNRTTPPQLEKEESRFRLANLHYFVVWFLVLVAAGWMTFQTFRITHRASWRSLILLLGVALAGGWSFATWRVTEPSPINWVPYSADGFAAAREKGAQTIVIEFTATWCLNCITIEHTVLNRADVSSRLNAPDVLALKADVSLKSAEGWKMLEDLGYDSIPLTVVYRPGVAEPTILSSFYTPASLLSAIGGTGVSSTLNYGPVLMLLIACVAGFLMNFTPCVLPVIPIKILSIQAHAGNPRKCMILGIFFSLGIIAVFALLGLFIAGVVGGTQKVGWGGLFQNWWFSALIGGIIGVMALGMLGLFNTNLPQFVYLFNPQGESALGNFLLGGFTAVLSTPCTGPLFGATLAWLLAQSPWIGLLTFICMGVGMALPYLILTSNPRWVDRMPRGGPGSELLKQVMALLMLAVAAYFVGVAVLGFSASA